MRTSTELRLDGILENVGSSWTRFVRVSCSLTRGFWQFRSWSDRYAFLLIRTIWRSASPRGGFWSESAGFCRFRRARKHSYRLLISRLCRLILNYWILSENGEANLDGQTRVCGRKHRNSSSFGRNLRISDTLRFTVASLLAALFHFPHEYAKYLHFRSSYVKLLLLYYLFLRIEENEWRRSCKKIMR
jgi:hypothetical protein